MKPTHLESKDGRIITTRHADPKDARDLHLGFRQVVEEGLWLPTLAPNASVADWVTWIQRTQHCREVLLVAHLNGLYAGHLTLQPEEWTASKHVAKLGIIVLSDFRNIGVGRALMLEAETAAVEREYEKIVLSTFETNTMALSLYESLGYRIVGQRARHFKMPKGFIDEVLMEKALNV
jgi:ribosomal protein S18 acetylase RimI-like enzyme